MFNLFLKARNSKKKGFTIIEMVVVIAVIGILTSVLMPNFTSSLTNAKSTATAANLSTMNKIAKSAMTDSDISMLKGYAAAVQNFGYDNVKETVKNSVYDASSHSFKNIEKVDTSDGYDLNYYWPVCEADGKTALESFTSLEFVTKVDGAQNMITKINAKAIIDDTNKYNAIYFVSGSIALYDDLNLGDAALVLLDGASLELNGKTLGCKALVLLDTTGGTEEVKFSVNGGMVSTFLGYSVTSVSNFWNADKSMNLTADPAFSASNKISVDQDSIVTTSLGGAFVDVANCSYYLYGGILVAEAGTFTIANDTHFVVNDGAYLLTDNGDSGAKGYSAVKIAFDSDTTLDVSENSVVSLQSSDDAKDLIINGHTQGSDTWNSINPLTYEVCSSAVQNTLVLYAQAGADLTSVMAVADKFATSVNNTVSGLSTAGLVTAQNATAAIATANNGIATAVYGAVSSATSAVATTVANASAGAAVASLAGVTSSAALRTLASTTASGQSTSANAAVNNMDYSWYSEKTASNATGYTEEGGVKTYHITTAKQLYSLSWVVAKGLDDFNGSVVSIDANLDLSAYQPWQPIGNGTYGFRGYMTGNGNTISNMTINTESLTTITSLIGQAWSGTANRAKLEGVNYGIQTGDKYALGFIGVLENGGTLTNINFSNCTVKFNYNWNCSAAIAVGTIVTSGEDYSYQHDGNVISGDPSGAYNFVTYGTSASAKYNANGPKWEAASDGTTTYSSGLKGTNVTEIDYRAYTGWITTVSNVTTDSSCSVECSGRPGGIVGSVGGRYSKGTPNNEYGDEAKYGAGATDGNSIFCSFGTANITGCTNNATVKQNFQKTGYTNTAGIAAYFVNKGGSGYAWNITGCVNNGKIEYSELKNAGAIVGDHRSGVNLSGNTFDATKSGIDKATND